MPSRRAVSPRPRESAPGFRPGASLGEARLREGIAEMAVCRLRAGARHLPAFLGALVAGRGALLAMIVLMLLAFGRTSFTHFGTNAAYFLGKLRSAAHQCGSSPAHGGAVAVGADTIGHLLYIGLL